MNEYQCYFVLYLYLYLYRNRNRNRNGTERPIDEDEDDDYQLLAYILAFFSPLILYLGNNKSISCS